MVGFVSHIFGNPMPFAVKLDLDLKAFHKRKVADNEDFKKIIPIAITGRHFDFTLFAVWAYNPTDTDSKYITQVWKANNHPMA